VLTAEHVLLAFGLLVAYCLFLIARPNGRCGRCHGRRFIVRRNWLTGKRRRVKCPRCRGRAKAPHRGSALVHRFLWLLLADVVAERLKARYERHVDGRS